MKSVISPSPSLSNSDLAPVPPEQRIWTQWHIAAVWVGMAVCITPCTLASGLIAQGMNGWQAMPAVLSGNLIVLIPMTLNAHPGTACGIPFPLLLRASFGTFGANIPAMTRRPDKFAPAEDFWPVFGAGVTAMVGYWATLPLNIFDFPRYARRQRDEAAGQAPGLPLTIYSKI